MTNRQKITDIYMNEVFMYGGFPLRRADIIRDLQTRTSSSALIERYMSRLMNKKPLEVEPISLDEFYRIIDEIPGKPLVKMVSGKQKNPFLGGLATGVGIGIGATAVYKMWKCKNPTYTIGPKISGRDKRIYNIYPYPLFWAHQVTLSSGKVITAAKTTDGWLIYDGEKLLGDYKLGTCWKGYSTKEQAIENYINNQSNPISMKEYSDYMSNRERIISENRSRRMMKKRLPPLEVPPKLSVPKARIAYDKEGNYMGRLRDNEEAPEGAIVKMEDAKWNPGKPYTIDPTVFQHEAWYFGYPSPFHWPAHKVTLSSGKTIIVYKARSGWITLDGEKRLGKKQKGEGWIGYETKEQAIENYIASNRNTIIRYSLLRITKTDTGVIRGTLDNRFGNISVRTTKWYVIVQPKYPGFFSSTEAGAIVEMVKPLGYSLDPRFQSYFEEGQRLGSSSQSLSFAKVKYT